MQQGIDDKDKLIQSLRNDLKSAQDNERRLTTLVQSAPICIHEIDLNGQITSMNRCGLDLMGMQKEEEICGDYYIDFVCETQKTLVNKLLEKAFKGEYNTFEFSPEKSELIFSSCFAPVFDEAGDVEKIMGITENITDRRHLESQLSRAQKMDAVGQLAGGIAHDFNNILAIIQGNADLLELKIKNDTPNLERVKTIQHTTHRAADLTRQLLGFSRKKTRQTKTVKINRLIEELEDLIGRSITPQVEVQHHFADNLWLAEVDPGDFQDALLNLIINARDAMTGKGKLNIDSRNTTLCDSFCKKNVGSQPGDYVEVSVSDSGKGISPEFIDKIFEPFFTTKEVGKGTGLGLSMVFGFIKRSKGYIHVYSEVDIGTTFKMYLPREMTEKRDDKQALKQGITLARGTETLLIVDDEEDLLQVVQDKLSTLGYRVLTASNGQQALEVLADEPAIALLFSDVVMPGGINGYELAGLVTNQRPDIKVLLTSGYTEKAIAQNGQSRFNANLLIKPYTQINLALIIRELLDEAVQIEQGLI